MTDNTPDGRDFTIDAGELRGPTLNLNAVTAHCPHCHREEDFDDQATAQAWLTMHIRTEHGDKLPKLGGTPDQ